MAGKRTSAADNPDTKTGSVIKVLEDGPSTTGEVASSLGWTVHVTCAHLKNLHLAGRVARVRFPTGDRRVRFLWSLAA